jgi:hypothetical protein
MPALSEILEFVWAVINNWAGYATGGLIVATVSFYLVWNDKPMARNVALVLSALFLLMAFFRAWRDKKRALQASQTELAVERDRKQPKLSGEIGLAVTAPGREAHDSMVMLFATIKNNGAPSIAEGFESRVRLPSGQELPINAISFLPKGPLKLFGAEGGPELEVAVSEELRRKAIAQPIPTGGAINGFFMGLVRGADVSEVFGEGATYFLSFKDSMGKRYEISISGAKKTDFILPEQLGARES